MQRVVHFWRRTPPALFPGLLGLFGLALVYRQAGMFWDIPVWIGELLGVIATLVFLFTFTSYLAKLVLRPSVLWEDLRIDPAKAAVSAGSMCAMLLSAFLLWYSVDAAMIVWWFAVILHAVYLTSVLILLFRTKDVISTVSPVLILPFVGLLLAAIVAPEFGYVLFAKAVIFLSMPVSMLIIVLSLMNALKNGVPIAQRSSFAIIVAPPSVAVLGAYEALGPDVYIWFYVPGTLCGLLFVPYFQWMAKDGYHPGWGGIYVSNGVLCVNADSGRTDVVFGFRKRTGVCDHGAGDFDDPIHCDPHLFVVEEWQARGDDQSSRGITALNFSQNSPSRAFLFV